MSYNKELYQRVISKSYIKADSPQVKDVVNFADRFWYVLEQEKEASDHYAKV
jgi:hypothetical protein